MSMKEILRNLFLQTLDRIALDRIIPEKLRCREGVLAVGSDRIQLKRYERILVVAIGKASLQMAEIVADILQPYPVTGVASGVGEGRSEVPGLTCFHGGHPYPNADSFRAGDAVVALLQNLTSRDLVIYLLSGGGSAICEKPIFPDIGFEEYRELYKLLVTCGAAIVDVNFIRKHLSAIKGGRLTELAFPARQVTIYVSDAPPANPSNVASGPTMPDESTAEDCYRIVENLKLVPRLPSGIRRVFEEKSIPETPKLGAEIFQTSSWHCLLTPEDAIYTLQEEIHQKGWVVETDLLVGDHSPLQCATRHLIARLEELRLQHRGRTVALVVGGELSCPVIGDGLGGRNQAFVLDCVPKIAGRNVAVLSAGTDGIDGTSPAAGAVADGTTLERASQSGLDPAEYARRSDSYTFFSKLGDALMTGPTGNNVRDLRILVAW